MLPNQTQEPRHLRDITRTCTLAAHSSQQSSEYCQECGQQNEVIIDSVEGLPVPAMTKKEGESLFQFLSPSYRRLSIAAMQRPRQTASDSPRETSRKSFIGNVYLVEPQIDITPSRKSISLPRRLNVNSPLGSQLPGISGIDSLPGSRPHKLLEFPTSESAGPKCSSLDCPSPSVILQSNGFCTLCNRQRRSEMDKATVSLRKSQKSFSSPVLSTLADNVAFRVSEYQPFARVPHEGLPQVGEQKHAFQTYLRLKILLKKALSENVDLLEIWSHFDSEGGGVGDAQMRNGLRRLGLDITREETRIFMEMLSLDGPVQRARFLNALGIDDKNESAVMSSTNLSNTRRPSQSEERVTFKKRMSTTEKKPDEARQQEASPEDDASLLKRVQELRTIIVKDLRLRKLNQSEMFAEIDTQRNGSVGPPRFATWLKKIKFRVADSNLKQLFDILDIRALGSIYEADFREFCEATPTKVHEYFEKAESRRKKKVSSGPAAV